MNADEGAYQLSHLYDQLIQRGVITKDDVTVSRPGSAAGAVWENILIGCEKLLPIIGSRIKKKSKKMTLVLICHISLKKQNKTKQNKTKKKKNKTKNKKNKKKKNK